MLLTIAQYFKVLLRLRAQGRIGDEFRKDIRRARR